MCARVLPIDETVASIHARAITPWPGVEKRRSLRFIASCGEMCDEADIIVIYDEVQTGWDEQAGDWFLPAVLRETAW